MTKPGRPAPPSDLLTASQLLVRDSCYGRTRFGQSCLLWACRLIEAGVRFVTVNMFETVFDEVTWDIHGSRPFTDIVEMARQVAPRHFDQAFAPPCSKISEHSVAC